MALAALVLATLVVPVAGAGSPSQRSIEALIRARVKFSRAGLERLVVDVGGRRLLLVVGVRDAAAYLKHRYEGVVETIFPRFERRLFKATVLGVVDARTGRTVFQFTDVLRLWANRAGRRPGGSSRGCSTALAGSCFRTTRSTPTGPLRLARPVEPAAPPRRRRLAGTVVQSAAGACEDVRVDDWLVSARRRLAASVGDEETLYDLDGETAQMLLDLARIAAHESNDRTNAPLLAYLVGLAHGRHPDRSLADLAATAADASAASGLDGSAAT